MSALLTSGILPLPFAAGNASSGKNNDGLSLDDFMRLSTALTGHAGLDKELGQIYLDALLHTPQDEDDLIRLLTGLEEGEIHAYVREKPSSIARELLLAWYTGHYPTMSGPKVATFTQALAWRALGYTTAPSLCGGTMGHWGDKPQDT
jgi:D-sorbitol dehydrogenase-like protein